MVRIVAVGFVVVLAVAPRSSAQVAPDETEIRAYRGLFAAAAAGDVPRLDRLLRAGAATSARDRYGRTPAHVAAHFGHHRALRTLLRSGINPNALENDRYDVITIAAVLNDAESIRIAVAAGARATNTTSRYDGTALIAAAHLGNVEAVRALIDAGAPVDHVNNLGWTALVEAVVLGDGGSRHTSVVDLLVRAGADVDIADRSGQTPLDLARERGYEPMIRMLTSAGAR